MLLDYVNKKDEKEILDSPVITDLIHVSGQSESKCKLIHSENFQALKILLEKNSLKGKVDFIYIDPPFSTNNVFKISQDRANTISSSNNDETAYSDHLQGADFIEFLRERLILLRELMSDKASIYLHIDYKIGHYVKVMMDEVFGINNFRNDITRIKCNPKNFDRKAFGNIKDLVLFYSKTDDYIWNEPKRALNEDDLKRLYKKVDANGRYYTTVPLHAPGETKEGPTGRPWRSMMPPKGRHWRCDPKKLEELDKEGLIEWSSNGVPRRIIYAEDAKENGVRLQDILEFKDTQTPSYPTEKNIEFLQLLIKTSSKPDSIVLDCFCGSGTTLVAAKELGRDWIGIDQSKHAIEVAQKRIDKTPNDVFTADYELLSSKEFYKPKIKEKQLKHKTGAYQNKVCAG